MVFIYIICNPNTVVCICWLKLHNGIIILGTENVKMMIQVTCKVNSIHRLLEHVSAKICSHLQGEYTKGMLLTKCATNWNKSYLYITHHMEDV